MSTLSSTQSTNMHKRVKCQSNKDFAEFGVNEKTCYTERVISVRNVISNIVIQKKVRCV